MCPPALRYRTLKSNTVKTMGYAASVEENTSSGIVLNSRPDSKKMAKLVPHLVTQPRLLRPTSTHPQLQSLFLILSRLQESTILRAISGLYSERISGRYVVERHCRRA